MTDQYETFHEHKISSLIETQFPEYFREEGQTFVLFVKEYFRWLEGYSDIAESSFTGTGHITVNAKQANVSGRGTDFTTWFANGDSIAIFHQDSQTEYDLFTIDTVANSTFPTLSTNTLPTFSSSTLGIPRSIRVAATMVVLAALALQFAIAWEAVALLSTGRMPAELVTPALYLPIVPGGLVGAMALVAIGYPGWAALLFGSGVGGWALLEVRILHQLFAGPLPAPIRPTLGIEIAPAMGIVAGLGMLFFVNQPLDYFARAAFDVMNSFTFTAIPLFVFMGTIYATTGIVRGLFQGAEKMFGNIPGSLASAVIVPNAIFGAISGSGVAAAATFGRICFPEMQNAGYDAKMSLGAIAISGTLSVLIPPSLIMIVYGGWMDVSVARLFEALAHELLRRPSFAALPRARGPERPPPCAPWP